MAHMLYVAKALGIHAEPSGILNVLNVLTPQGWRHVDLESFRLTAEGMLGALGRGITDGPDEEAVRDMCLFIRQQLDNEGA